MSLYYSAEKNTLRLIYLMKQHGIKKVVISPGAQNICFVGSLQNDSFFELYSAPDERSAAYIACGLAAESGEAVALSCTGATASRNYIPGLTEAFYRKLPVLAITATKHQAYIGQNVPQIVDRSVLQKDIVKKSVYIPTIENKDDDWEAIVAINEAILELTHNGGGPAHINLETTHSSDYSVTELPPTRVINRIEMDDMLPELKSKRIAIFVGAHQKWTVQLREAVDRFCELYNAVVLCDHTSNYNGSYKVYPSLITYQSQYTAKCTDIDLLIDIGNISGGYIELKPKEVWRVNPDGAIRDTYRKLRYVFQMEELHFFKSYISSGGIQKNSTYYQEWNTEYHELQNALPELPFSNIWVASQLIPKIHDNSILHIAILNSLRSCNFFASSNDIECYCNTGGFGIDGPISTVLGGALANPSKTHYLIVGDLAFFYDLNALGNRHFPNNVRILLINNGVGTEFKNYNHKAALFNSDADQFMAARGHYGNKSSSLVKHYAEDLGFEYITSSTKASFLSHIDHFIEDEKSKSVIFEVFTDSEEESQALKMMKNIKSTASGTTKTIVKQVLGKNNITKIKHFLGK